MSDKEIHLTLGDTTVPVYLRETQRARRVSLRVDAPAQRIILVKPRRVSQKAAIEFATERADWVVERIAEFAVPIPFEPGAHVPVQDIQHVIVHTPDARRGVWTDGGCIYVSGQPEFISRRVRDWFKDHARDIISPIAREYAATIGRSISRVSVRDQRSRWGSCTADGVLSFSWRVVMAPESVMRYVIAHEVSHLRELNHSKKFWQLVDELVSHRAASTEWLSTHGLDLHRYGLEHA